MGVRPGYKQTEIGVIPQEWDSMPCSDLCVKIQDGTHFSPKVRGHDYLYLTSKNIRFGFLDISTAEHIDAAQHEAIYKRCDVKRGDLLLTKDGANTGNAALNILSEQFSLLSSVAFLRFDVSKHFPEYFLQQFLSTHGQQRMKDAMSGNAITRLTLQKIRKLRFPVAPQAEQRAIATALSDVDALLDGLTRLITKKRDLKQATMQQLLTGQTRLPGFSGEWVERAIGQLAEVGRGRVISHREISKSTDPKYPVFSSQTSNNGVMGFLDTYDFEGEYVTWTTDGANAGTVFARSGQFNCTNVCGTIKPYAGDCRFIAAALSRVAKPHVSRHLGNPKLMNDVMKRIKIRIPASASEQTAIATILSGMDAELDALEIRLTKTRALKQAMMSELLTGKIRLLTS